MTLPKSFWTDRLTGWHLAAAIALGLSAGGDVISGWISTLATKDEEYSHIFLVPVVALAMVYSADAMRHCHPCRDHRRVPRRLRLGATTYGFHHAHQGCGTSARWWSSRLHSSVLGNGICFFPAIAVLIFLVPCRDESDSRSPSPCKPGPPARSTGLEICG